jgi:hypothetical protein
MLDVEGVGSPAVVVCVPVELVRVRADRAFLVLMRRSVSRGLYRALLLFFGLFSRALLLQGERVRMALS